LVTGWAPASFCVPRQDSASLGCPLGHLPRDSRWTCGFSGELRMVAGWAPHRLRVGLNWGIGSNSLNADEKAFVRLHNVRGSNSG